VVNAFGKQIHESLLPSRDKPRHFSLEFIFFCNLKARINMRSKLRVRGKYS